MVANFKRELPGAADEVYDNNSSERTAELAAGAGTTVVAEPRHG